MLFDLNASPPQFEVPSFDFVIVGAGAVGLLLASELAEAGHRVAVLESGGAVFDAQSKSLNDVVVTGRQHDGVLNGRARVLGGTTTLWGGQLTRFSKIDFEARPLICKDGWPIQLHSLLPFYKRVEELFALDSAYSEDDAVATRVSGYDGFDFGSLKLFFTRWLAEPNFSTCFAAKINYSANLSVYCHATVRDFDSDGAGTGIEAMLVRSTNGDTYRFQAKSFILAAGTIEISRLLLWFGRQHSDAKWAQNRWIGKYFQDHLDVVVGKLKVIDKKRFDSFFQNIIVDGHKYQPKLRLSDTCARELGIPGVACSLIFRSRVSEHLAHLKRMIRSFRTGSVGLKACFEFPRRLFGAASVWAPLVIRYLSANRIYSPSDLGIFLNIHCEQKPLAESDIGLSLDRYDANGVPLAQINWQVSVGPEMSAIRSFIKRVGEFLSSSGLATLELDEDVLAGSASVLERARDSFHQCGGAVMSASSKEGVVDPFLKVHDCRNLHIAGAATFPSSSFANPTFTALALTLRLADTLKQSAELSAH